jgi:hypothetical protein
MPEAGGADIATDAGGGRDAGDIRCAQQDDADITLCAGRCVDLVTDPSNCGSCGHVCDAGVCSSAACP